jgi:hypothetical protein
MDIKDSVIDQLIHSTVRIECIDKLNQSSTGTGYFFEFKTRKGHVVPTIVTNKHVIENGEIGKFNLTLKDQNGNPKIGEHYNFVIPNFEKNCLLHTDKNVDLAVIPIAPFLEQLKADKKEVFYITLNADIIPSDESLTKLFAMENIIMIGYPNGIWDKVNNFPIIRRGITATPPFVNYNGKSEFMIDAACFPGSSGSPVFLFDNGIYTERGMERSKMGVRCFLLGTLYAGPQHTATGDIRVIDIPTKEQSITISRIPNNLGLVIKSKRLLDFIEIFDNLIG